MKRLDTFGNVKRRRTTPPNWTGLQMGDGYGNDQVSSSLHWIIVVKDFSGKKLICFVN